MGESEPPSKRRKTASLKTAGCKTKIVKAVDAPPELQAVLEAAYQVKFDKDTVAIWKWCQTASQPLNALKDLDLQLIGPFRYLHTFDASKENNATKDASKTATLNHMLDRVWQCPPEFMPCLKDSSSLFGFWRDEPSEEPVFVVQKEDDSGVFTPVATDLVQLILDIAAKKRDKKLTGVFTAIRSTHNSSHVPLRKVISARRKNVVASTLNKVGIVVKLKEADVGYRPITMTYSELDRMLTAAGNTEDDSEKDRILAPFDECVTYIQFANDECDFGMGFELGMCVFAHKTSKTYIRTVESLLPLAYELMDKPLYAGVMRALCKQQLDLQ